MNTKFHLSDVGTARRFVENYKDKVRYCPTICKWFIFNGKFWEMDEKDRIIRLTIHLIEGMYEKSESYYPSKNQKAKRFEKYLNKISTYEKIQDILELVKTFEEIQVDLAELDTHRHLFNCQNCTVDLITGDCFPHDSSYLITKMSKIIYAPDASCPLWGETMKNIFEEKDKITYYQDTMGYCLSGFNNEQSIYMHLGDGANGKSTVNGIIIDMFGSYAKLISAKQFIKTLKTSNSIDLEDYRAVRLAYITELSADDVLNDNFVKQLTGCDIIKARLKNGKTIEYKPESKNLVYTNNQPKTKRIDFAIYRRIKPLKFNKIISNEDQDKFLTEKLAEETSGIFNWLMQGFQKWNKNKTIIVPQTVLDETISQKLLGMGEVSLFYEECLIKRDHLAITIDDFLDLYNTWQASSIGENIKPLSKQLAGKILKEFAEKITYDGETIYAGIGTPFAFQCSNNFKFHKFVNRKMTIESFVEYYTKMLESSQKEKNELKSKNLNEVNLKLEDKMLTRNIRNYKKMLSLIDEHKKKLARKRIITSYED